MSTKKIKVIKLTNKRIVIDKNLIKGFRLKPCYKEDVLYETEKCEFLGEYRKVKIVNRLHCIHNTSRTIANCETDDGTVYTRTSDRIVNLIGQANYDTVLSSLCSVINQELKVRGIISLLTEPNKIKNNYCQTSAVEVFTDQTRIIPATVIKKNPLHGIKKNSDKETQTCANEGKECRAHTNKRRRGPAPYVVTHNMEPEVKKIVVQPQDFKLFKPELSPVPAVGTEETLQDLGNLLSLDDNDSRDRMSWSGFSVESIPLLLNNPIKLVDNVDKHTQEQTVCVVNNNSNDVSQDSTALMSPRSTELGYCDPKKIMSSPLRIEQRNYMIQQIINDWRTCLVADEDGYLPIHIAVIDNNVELLKRQCILLNIKKESVDIQGNGKLTALKMSLYQENPQLTATLLQFGADPLRCYEDDRTPFHIAAEMVNDNLEMLIAHCGRNARKILEDEDLMKPGLQSKSDQELTEYLFDHISKLCDSQGYTPLMVASKFGIYENARKLLEMCPKSVNFRMPTSGNTALYSAVSGSCIESRRLFNESKVTDKFEKTIKLLLENGADPTINNLSGVSVNEIVSEVNCAELSMLVANHFMSKDTHVSGPESLMIIRGGEKERVLNKQKVTIVKNEVYSPAVGSVKSTKPKQSNTVTKAKNSLLKTPLDLSITSTAKKRKAVIPVPETSGGGKSSKSGP